MNFAPARFRSSRSERSRSSWGSVQAPSKGGFADWRLAVDGLVARPRRSRSRNSKASREKHEITLIGVRRGLVLHRRVDRRTSLTHSGLVGTLPQARYVVYRSIQPDWWESIDMADALHPQTLVAHGMNGGTFRSPSADLSTARSPAARLQERQIHHPPHRDR